MNPRSLNRPPLSWALACGLLFAADESPGAERLLSCSQAATSHQAATAPDASISNPSLHPTVSQIRGIRIPPDLSPDTSGIIFDGFWLPGRIETDLENTDEDYDPEKLELSLVSPGTVEFDGVSLEVKLPFYIATRELATNQVGALGGLRWTSQLGYYFWQSQRWRHDERVPFDSLDHFKIYMQKPEHPAIVFDPDLAVELVRQLNESRNATFDLPSVGQWMLAMRAGQPSRYWWGDTAAAAPAGAISSIPGKDTSKLRGFRPVGEGVANPLGLVNMIGNLRELALPSDVERNAIAARLEKRSDLRAETAGIARPTRLPRGAWLALGGASWTPMMFGLPVSSTELSAELDLESDSWEAIVRLCQVEFDPTFTGGRTWCSGLRVVLPISPRNP
ncbi:MAG: SUMF1/EgtB/PvdO family nonheme iron enzyme [Phycisphaerae bacterium]|nr:SUMF1/EgtB/PvdO family nonheme iron enzyme [Phycisphaerae bacterium]